MGDGADGRAQPRRRPLPSACTFKLTLQQKPPNLGTATTSLFLRNRGDWRSTEPSELGPDYRVVAHAATLALLQSLSSQGFSFFVSTLEALNFQPVGLANPSAEGWWPQRGDVFPGPAGLQKAR